MVPSGPTPAPCRGRPGAAPAMARPRAPVRMPSPREGGMSQRVMAPSKAYRRGLGASASTVKYPARLKSSVCVWGGGEGNQHVQGDMS